MDEKLQKDFTRRTFIKGAALGTAGIASAGFLAGCSPKDPGDSGEAGSNAASWRTPPEPIKDSQISETLEADIVVVGTGAAGSIALTTALDAGASVIALQKANKSISHGLYNGGVDTILQRAAGITVDVAEWKTRWLHNSGNWGSIPHLNQWVKYSGTIINKLFTLSVEHEGDADCPIGPIKAYNSDPVYEDDWMKGAPTSHVLNDPYAENQTKSLEYLDSFGVADIAEWLTQQAIKRGADVRYDTPAVQLIRGGKVHGKNGRVEGVIAKDKNGNYIKCLAKKGVVFCAGGYSNDEELKQEFLPHIAKLRSGYSATVNTGDAHKMGTWIGAQMRRVPHTSNPHYDPSFINPNVPGSGYPWMRVNLNGERYCNEDVIYEQMYAQDLTQPECTHFQIFDDNYHDDVEKFSAGTFRSVSGFQTGIPEKVKSGDVYSAATIGELAKAIGVPAENLEKTVARYNDFAHNGYDEEFGKRSRSLMPIEKAPFYAIKRQPVILDSMSGLMTNTNFQVLDEEDKPVEGFYAAGNCQSPFFGGFVQPMNMSSMGTGRAFTTGHVAVLHACGIDGTLWPTTDELLKEHPEYMDIAKKLQGV